MPPSQPLPQSMVAWQLKPVFLSSTTMSKLTLNQTAPVPQPKNPDQTLVKVLSAALNPVDYKMSELPLVARVAFGAATTPGMDYVGRVWATNLPASAGITAGDIVFGKLAMPGPNGSLAGYTVAKGTDGLIKAPLNVELDELAGVGVAGLTALQSLASLEDQGEGSARGKSVLINGSSGGVGTFTVQIAKALGCENIVVTCSSANADLVRSLGATEVIDYRSTNVVEAAVNFVKTKNSGRKFDLVIDNAGADMGLYWRAHDYLKDGAKYIFVGAGLSLGSLAEITKVMLWPGVLGGGKRTFQFLQAKESQRAYERIGQWMSQGAVKCIIDQTFNMEEVPAAYERLKTGRSRGKIIVRVSEDGRGDN